MLIVKRTILIKVKQSRALAHANSVSTEIIISIDQSLYTVYHIRIPVLYTIVPGYNYIILHVYTLAAGMHYVYDGYVGVGIGLPIFIGSNSDESTDTTLRWDVEFSSHCRRRCCCPRYYCRCYHHCWSRSISVISVIFLISDIGIGLEKNRYQVFTSTQAGRRLIFFF